MKALLNVALWLVSVACFGYAIYYWGWVAGAEASKTVTDFAIVISLIVVGALCVLAWFMMRRKDDDQEISITR